MVLGVYVVRCQRRQLMELAILLLAHRAMVQAKPTESRGCLSKAVD